MDLWKYGQILNIQKFLIVKWLNFSKKKFPHMSLSSCITLDVEFQLQIWNLNQNKNFHFVMF